MRFEELNNTIPLAKGGKEKVLKYSPYDNIVIAMPGRHWEDTEPKGGDFVVMVSDPVFPRADHQFKHSDIFVDVMTKRDDKDISFFMNAYLSVVADGDDPLGYFPGDNHTLPGMEFRTFMCAAQCLAVAEHRRYARFEKQYGGRFLPFRFAAGIAEGLWTATDAAAMERRGRPGVEILERKHGTPYLTKELLS